MNKEYRRAALIATAVTLPLIVIALLGVAALTGVGSGSSPGSGSSGAPPLSASAPPRAAAEAAPCAKVLAQLPVELGRLAPRIVHTKPDTPNVVAWGDPAIVLACGTAKPKALYPGSSEQLFNAGSLSGPFYLVSRAGDANVYTVIDRQPFVSITIPAKYQAADYLPDLVGAIGKALPTAVCSTQTTAPPDTLCTRRTD